MIRIANNLVLQRRTKALNQLHHESLVGDLTSTHEVSVGEVFDTIAVCWIDGPENSIVEREQIQHALAQLSATDREILELSVSYTHPEIAQHLGLTRTAGRVRYKRALDRFRAAWKEQETQKRGESNE
jgi:DNA-directed RNA polymerase specialized sigma24 family protein